jgi:hypothetical protein
MTFNIAQPGTGSRTFAFSITAGGNANIIEFDDSTGGFVNNSARNSGVLLKQTVSALTNNYAFGFVGIDSSKNRFGQAGQFTITGSNVSGTLDSDDAISGASSNVSFTGTYTLASNGRGTITIGADSYVFYVVNASQLLALEIDPFSPGLHPLVSGTMLQQTASSSFAGNSVFELAALEGSTTESQIGQFMGSGGTFSVTSDQNTASTLTSPSGTGTYSIGSNGRVMLATTTSSGFQNSTTTSQPVLYLVTTNQAFIIGTDTAVSFGFMTPQFGSPFTTASLSGTYAGGSLAPVDPDVSNAVTVAVAGLNTLTITQDVSNANGLSLNQATGATALTNATTGRFTATLGSTSEILYMVSPTQYFALSTDATARVDSFGQ